MIYICLIYTCVNENTGSICLPVRTNMCTQIPVKTQSSIFKMLFMVVILLLPEPKQNLPLI